MLNPPLHADWVSTNKDSEFTLSASLIYVLHLIPSKYPLTVYKKIYPNFIIFLGGVYATEK